MSQENAEVATRLVIFDHLLSGVAANPRQIPVLTTPAAAVTLISTNGRELLSAGCADAWWIWVDPAGGVVRLAVPRTRGAAPLGLTGQTPGLEPNRDAA